MKAKLISLMGVILIMGYAKTMGQVGINSNGAVPHASAMLDVAATNKGVLLPRVALTGTNDNTTILGAATSLLIYNTASAGTSPYNVVPGFYYWDGLQWVTMVPSGGFTHYVGELFQGGIIVALWKLADVEHGLIASLVDISASSVWSNVGNLIGSTAENPYDGLANTNAIIAQAGFTGGAAKLCHDYTGGGYNDWYLPASWELNLCYNAAFIVNPILGSTNCFKASLTSSDSYWSSTEQGMISAFTMNFYDGKQCGSCGNKGFTFRVRAVRRF